MNFQDSLKRKGAIMVSGMGRSGTSWVGDMINSNNDCRVLFEPFFPGRVPEANGFEYIQYLNPEHDDPKLARQAGLILSGRLHNQWVDRSSLPFPCSHILIKDIRTNLMLGWLKKIEPELRIVVVIRQPLQVILSWKKLKWGRGWANKKRDIDIILSQKMLLEDYPVIKEALNLVDIDDFFESLVLQWCIFQMVPMRQFCDNDIYYLFYEKLVTRPDEELARLLHFLTMRTEKKLDTSLLLSQSQTNFLGRDYRKDTDLLLNGWKNEFSLKQREKAQTIMGLFSLDVPYCYE